MLIQLIGLMYYRPDGVTPICDTNGRKGYDAQIEGRDMGLIKGRDIIKR